jgi:hypothetical protein
MIPRFSAAYQMVTVIAIAALSATAFANSVELNQTSGYYSGIGGEFTASSPDSILNPASLGYSPLAMVGGGFQTFCLEYSEEFYTNTPYQYGISGAAISGGGASGGAHLVGSVWTDPVSVGTAWLYRQFATGVLSGYNYGAGRSTSAGALQDAIWYLEGEQPTVGTGSLFVSLAETTLGLTLTGLEADANGLYGVSALNLGDITNNPEFPHQDQLVLTPGYEATVGNVADGGGGTMTLMGGALLFLGALRSRRPLAA